MVQFKKELLFIINHMKTIKNAKKKEDNMKKKSYNRKKTLRTILVILIVILLILSSDSLTRLALLFLFLAVNFFLALGKRILPKIGFAKYLFGIELVMFCTVITSVSFGSVIGAITGALLMVINYIGEKRFSQYFIVTITLYSIIGYTAYYFQKFDVVYYSYCYAK
jgi:cobalamin synthase